MGNHKAHEYVDTAREVLKATGWCRGRLGDWQISEVDGDGEHCAIGALAAAKSILEPKSSEVPSAYSLTGREYNKAIEAVYQSLPAMNRTAAEDDLHGMGPSHQFRVDAIVGYNDSLDKKDKPKLLRVFSNASRRLKQGK